METIKLSETNPFLRAAMIQPAVMEGKEPRIAYDNRLFLVLEGTGRIIIGGKPHPIAEGTVVCLAVGEEYYFSGRVRAVVLNFDFTRAFAKKRVPICPTPRAQYRTDLVMDTTVPREFSEPILMVVDERLKSELLSLVDTFVTGGLQRDALTSAMLKAGLVRIALHPIPAKNVTARLVEKLVFYIKSNATAIKSNADLGRVFSYHPAYLAEIFKQKTGKSMHAAILEEKMRIAGRLLIYTNYSVMEIASETGFSTRNHFCTAFKAHYGMTPLSYRERRSPYAEGAE